LTGYRKSYPRESIIRSYLTKISRSNRGRFVDFVLKDTRSVIWAYLSKKLSFVFAFFHCLVPNMMGEGGGEIIKIRPDDCFYHTLLCVMETIWKWKFYLSISTPLLCVIIKDVYTVYVTRQFLFLPVLNDTYLMIIWLFTKTNSKRTLNWACMKSKNCIFELM
jgi:hypothetical protein